MKESIESIFLTSIVPQEGITPIVEPVTQLDPPWACPTVRANSGMPANSAQGATVGRKARITYG